MTAPRALAPILDAVLAAHPDESPEQIAERVIVDPSNEITENERDRLVKRARNARRRAAMEA